ncbi:MAG: site-specific DNA-methyltransferase [Dialister sp.]|nr:site-specific DNA-methyltransferase [Dialister sp.]
MKFLDELKKVLSFDERFVGESNQIIKTKVSDAARANDEKLLKDLINNDLLKESFFTKVDDIYVFDKNKFVWVLESKEFLPDSFTMYKNKIGLVDSNNNLISQKQDVSLIWPYKDCVLEGGQTKEDQKRDEIFYNEILAPDQVNRLLAPKVLGNAKRYTKNEIEENIEFKEDDNLIIKGNNLLALSSLLEKFEGKVQLIYIDPPFNTGGDSFNYNDKFNRSAWLTFIKNRLLISKRLLSKSGSILVHIDWHEAHYLKIVLDEIFGENNFKNEIIWSYSSGGDYKNTFAKKHDTIFWYSNSYIYKFFPEDKMVCEKRGANKKNNMKKNIDSDGRIYFSIKSNGKEYRYYEDDLITPDDVWDIPILQQKDPERIGFYSQKPEKLLARIVGAFSEEKDTVLDFFSGSGTTAVVAHKMKRKFIAVEQIDNQIDLSLERLKKVLEGEQSGISKNVNWQGGGSFVYCELLEDNKSLISELEKAKNTDEVKRILNKAIDNGKLIPSVLPSDLKENQDEFDKLSLDEQKNLVMELLNKNQLYVNLSDIDDEDYKVSEADKEFTRSFYGKE